MTSSRSDRTAARPGPARVGRACGSGVVLAAYSSGTPAELPDFIAKIDRGFAHLEAGLPL